MRLLKRPPPTRFPTRHSPQRLLALLVVSLLLSALAVACGGSGAGPDAQQPAAPTQTLALTPDEQPSATGARASDPATQPPAGATELASDSRPTPARPPIGAPTAVEPDPTQPPAPTTALVPKPPLGSKKGNLAPSFSVTSVDGEVVSLDGLISQGQPFLLHFFATW